jgi:hypothetical protein
MSAFRDVVMGQGCTTDAAPAGNNPLSKLFSGLVDSKQKHEALAHVPDLQITNTERDKIASRAGVVTRHVFPGEHVVLQQQLILVLRKYPSSCDKSQCC